MPDDKKSLVRRPLHLKGMKPTQIREYIIDVLEGADCDPFLNLAHIANGRDVDGVSVPKVQVIGGKDRDEVIEIDGWPPEVILAANKELAMYAAPKYKATEITETGDGQPALPTVVVFAGTKPAWADRPRQVVDISPPAQLKEETCPSGETSPAG